MRLNIEVPSCIIDPPVPLTMPVTDPAVVSVIVKALAPRTTVPLPLKLVMEAELVTLEISNVPEFVTELESAIVPDPERLSVPALIVVAPV